MKAYKIELLVLDFDQLGGDEIKSVLENGSYPNDCIWPGAMQVAEADIGPWSDENPLNNGNTRAAEYARIFPVGTSPAAANECDALRKAAQAVMDVAMDEAQGRVHICDAKDENIKARTMSDEMRALYSALTAPQ